MEKSPQPVRFTRVSDYDWSFSEDADIYFIEPPLYFLLSA